MLKKNLYFCTPCMVMESHGKHTTKGFGKSWKTTWDVRYELCMGLAVIGRSRTETAPIGCDWPVVYRDGSDWLFDELHKHSVPLLIFSAGIGDVVMEAVKQRGRLHDNIKIVSNFMDFDSEVATLSFWCKYYFISWILLLTVSHHCFSGVGWKYWNEILTASVPRTFLVRASGTRR